MFYVSPLHMPPHITSPTGATQPQVATPPLHYFTPPVAPVALGYHPHAPMPVWVNAPVCVNEGPVHHLPPLPPHILQATGYPYLPHNPTQSELESCTRRMRSVKQRRSSAVNEDSGSEVGRSDVRDAHPHRRVSRNQTHLRFADPVEESDLSDIESNSNSITGRDTPDSSLKSCQDEVEESFNLPEDAQPVADAPSHTSAFLHTILYPTARDDTDSGSSVNKSAARSTIEEILYELAACILDFKMPSDLEFAALEDGEIFPKLPFTSHNRPLIHHKHHLDVLLDRLDNVESHGDVAIRAMRKHAVDEVKQSLKELNRRQYMAWFIQQRQSKQH
ncbi:BAG domain protein [Ceratobasidium sp. AG-Ba]|nr:BAG domain protein [Ceratobasidium sp. AG-Ba]QRW01406.1 BAG domain protein [Ceratobasidium sp. AG-Ba]